MDERVSELSAEFGRIRLVRTYPLHDKIWTLPPEKARRQMLADCQREIATEADRLAREPVTIRG